MNLGDGYTVSATKSSASVTVSDNDDPPPPEISITAGSAITEGGDATFTVTASPAPSSPLSVSVTVSQQGEFGVTTGSRTVTIPTSGMATLTIGATDDSADEPNGSVNVAVNSGSGYTVSSTNGSASVAVSDNDEPLTPGLPTVSVGDGSVVEGATGYLTLLTFLVALSEASDENVAVYYEVRGETAIGGSDYWGGYGRVTIWAGRARASIGVNVVDDNRRERDETLTVVLTSADGAVISADASTATGTIYDND